jgi:hypothetical protein
MSESDADHLQKSIEKFGLIDKPIINTDGEIIGGHQRVEVLRKMGVTEVECHVPDHTLSQKDINELCVRLNRNIGDWNWDILANEFEIEDLLNWGFEPEDMIGFAEPEEIITATEEEKKKKKTTCPNCGHEF